MLRTILFSLFSISVLFAHAQNPDTRPKVGLVLSGGAAHGFAHIGAIKYLEEIGIEVDNITGTSMGSVIGGLYAMGYNSQEIIEIAAEQDWDLLMSNHSPLFEVAPIEKEFHEKIPLSISWYEDAFRLPQGIIQGQKLDLIISKIYSPAYFIDDFDDLHIPFRCIAVDIEDGSIDVLDSGFLGEAIRASMAIPSIFPPKELDGTLYVDGGLRRNFPVEENKEMGSDILIGVYVGSERESKDNLNSIFDIFKQSSWMCSVLDSEEQKEMLDFYIAPKVKDMGSFAFDEYEKFIALGYEAAKEQKEELLALKEKLDKYPKPKRSPKLNSLDYLRFGGIQTTETDRIFSNMIINRLKFSENENVNFDQLEESLALIFGTKNFSKTSYDFEVEDDGIELIVNTEEVLPYNIGIGLNRFANTKASLILTGEARNVFGRPSNLRADIRISENPGAQLNYHHRFTANPSYLFKVFGKIERFDLPFYRGDVLDRFYKLNEGRIYAGLNKEWKNKFLFHLYYQYRHERMRPRVFNENDIKKYFTLKHGLEAGLEYNTLDRKVFPQEGQRSVIRAGYMFSNSLDRENQTEGADFLDFTEDNSYYYVELDHRSFWHTKRICGELYLKGRYSNGRSLLDHYRIGGPIQEKMYQYGFVGLDDSELIMGNHASAKFSLRYHFKKEIYFTPTIQYVHGEDYLSYAFGSERNISVLAYGVILGLNTPIGPVTFDLGYSTFNDKLVYNLGFGFRHIL